MTNLDDFRKNFEPAYRESEKDFFLRLSAEYNKITKREARQASKAYWINRLATMIQPLVSKPNLLHAS